jgi:SAM-dependent methyltransferase
MSFATVWRKRRRISLGILALCDYSAEPTGRKVRATIFQPTLTMNKRSMTKRLLKLSAFADSACRKGQFQNLLLRHKLGGFSSAPFPTSDSKRPNGDGKGSHSFDKLQEILARIPEGSRSVIDVGSNNGFFSIGLAQQGYSVIGYEPEREFVSGANQICDRYAVDNAAFFSEGLDVDSSESMFSGDVTLVLSVFHNWVKQYDFESAIRILINIWSHTRRAMFFELADTIDNQFIAGFESMPSMGTSVEECGQFIKTTILGRLQDAQVEFIRLMPTDYRNGSARHLFIVRRQS